MHIETASPILPELHMTSTQHEQSNHQDDRLGVLFENLHMCIAGFEKVLYSTNNQVQMRLTAIKT